MTEHHAFFFGCWGGPGHHLYQSSSECDVKVSPWQPRDIDCDGGPQPQVPMVRDEYLSDQPEGPAQLHHKRGWSMVAFWDRSADVRGGSNGAFIVEGLHTFAEVMEIAGRLFPQVVGRLTVPLTEWTP